MIAVRVADGGGGGGINGAVVPRSSPTDRSARSTEWTFRVGRLVFGTDGQRINKIPAVMYNRMVHPLLPFADQGRDLVSGRVEREQRRRKHARIARSSPR